SSSAQAPGQDPEQDKRIYLSQGNPTIIENAPCPQTCLGGVLWTTLVQIKNFLVGDTNGGSFIVTGGSEPDHHAIDPSGMGHLNGFKLDLNIGSSDTFADPLSQFIISNTKSTVCRSTDGAPEFRSGNGIVFAMEYPVPAGPNSNTSCVAHPIGQCCHWDIQSSFNSVSSPWDQTGMTIDVGQALSVSASAKDVTGQDINLAGWMFDYDKPSDSNDQIVSIDPYGTVTGVNTNLDGSAATVTVFV